MYIFNTSMLSYLGILKAMRDLAIDLSYSSLFLLCSDISFIPQMFLFISYFVFVQCLGEVIFCFSFMLLTLNIYLIICLVLFSFYFWLSLCFEVFSVLLLHLVRSFRNIPLISRCSYLPFSCLFDAFKILQLSVFYPTGSCSHFSLLSFISFSRLFFFILLLHSSLHCLFLIFVRIQS